MTIFNAIIRRMLELSLTYVLTIGFIILFIWALFFNIDQTIAAQGQIISEERTQIIQAVDGGILTDLRVHEGDAVEVGQVLAVLQKDVANANYQAALAEFSSSKAVLSSIQDELELTQKLLKTGDVGYLEVARLKRQVAEMEGRVRVNQNKLEQQQIYLDRMDLTSPVNGNIKIIKINTIGGVLRPGEEIMEVAPELTSLLIEVKISPADIGLVKIGLPANVKFEAFDYSVYGVLKGVVSYIGPDSLTEQGAGGQMNTFYRARIQVPPSELLNFHNQQAGFKLGMSVTADIKTGSRSLLRYIMKPIYKGFEGALHEK